MAINREEAMRELARREQERRQQPPGPTLGQKAADVFTGGLRETRATQELPELGFGGVLSTEPALDVLKMAPGLLLAGPQEREQILSQLPNIGIVEDEKGNKIAVNKQTGAHSVINKPGFSGSDIQQLIATTAAFAPAAGFAGAGRTAIGGGGAGLLDTVKRFVTSRLMRGMAGGAATEAGIQEAQRRAGGEFDPTQVGIAGGLGGGVEVLGPLAKRLFTPKSRQIVGETLEQSFGDVPSIQRSLLELGPEGRLMDISAGTRGLATGAAQTSPIARGKVTDFLAKRAAGTSSRIKGIMRKQFGAKGKDFSDFLENTITDRAKQAGPLYEAARKQAIAPQAMDDLMRFADDIANTDRVSGHTAAQSAINKLKRTLVKKVDGETVAKTSVDGIDSARETFGAQIFKLRQDKKIGPKVYEELVRIRDKFDDIMPEEFVQANKIFSSESKVIDAYGMGSKFFSMTDDQLAQEFKRMSVAEQDGYLAGLAKAVSTKVGKRVPTGEVPKALRTEEFMDKLKIILPEDVADDFIKNIESEGVMSATRNAIVGNSETAMRRAAERRFGEQVGERMISAQGIKQALFKKRGVTEKTADEIADILIQGNLNPRQIETILNANIPPKALPAAVRAMVQTLNVEQ